MGKWISQRTTASSLLKLGFLRHHTVCQPAWVVHLSAARAVSPGRRLDSRQHSCWLKGTVVGLKAQLWTPIQRSSDTFIAASAKPPCCASMQCSLLKRNHCTIKASTMHYALCSYPGQDSGHSCEHRSGQNAHQSSHTFIAASAKPPRLC